MFDSFNLEIKIEEIYLEEEQENLDFYKDFIIKEFESA